MGLEGIGLHGSLNQGITLISTFYSLLQRPVETQFVPLGPCAQLDSVYVPIVSTLHLALCVAVMVSPTSVPVSYEKLPVSSRYKLRRPVQGRVSMVSSGNLCESLDPRLWQRPQGDSSPFLQLSVARGDLVLGKTTSVSRSYAGSMVVSGMRTQKMDHVSVTLAARVS